MQGASEMMIFVAGFIGGCIATLFVLYVLSFFDKGHNYDDPKQLKPPQQCFRYGSPVLVTGGAYQGMYGKIIGDKIGDEWHIDMPLITDFITDKDRKSTRLNSSHQIISYAVFCLKKKKNTTEIVHHY